MIVLGLRFAHGKTVPYGLVYRSLTSVVKDFHWAKELKTVNESSVTKLPSHLFGVRQPKGRVRGSIHLGRGSVEIGDLC